MPVLINMIMGRLIWGESRMSIFFSWGSEAALGAIRDMNSPDQTRSTTT